MIYKIIIYQKGKSMQLSFF